MSTLNDFFGAAEHTLLLIRQLVGCAGTFLRALFLPRAALAARLLAAESQLAACRLRIHQRRQPVTVKRWHTAAFRLYWRWRSRKKPGRPPIAKEMKDLILRLSRENPRWGAERIGDTLRESTAFGRQPRYLFRDNDAIYGHGVRAFLDRCNIE